MAKKQGNIERAFSMYTKNMAKYGKGKVPEIAKKLGVSVSTVRGYVYRKRNPEKYKAAVQRYFDKKRATKEAEKAKAGKKVKKARPKKAEKKK